MLLVNRLYLLFIGWKRRSAHLLDIAGCPAWLWKLRCRVTDAMGVDVSHSLGEDNDNTA